MDAESFLARAARYHDGGWRLAVINATSILSDAETPEGAFDISWSFAKGSAFEHIRERVVPGEAVPSISGLFDGAFLYENELRELFGIDVTGIAVDLHGQLYKTAVRVPFAPSAIRARLEASGRAPGAKHEAPARPPAAAKPVAPVATPSNPERVAPVAPVAAPVGETVAPSGETPA